MRRLAVVLALVVSSVDLRLAHATEPDVVLSALISEALEHSPELAAARANARAAAERPAQASALPPTMLSAVYTNDGWGPTLGERDMTTLAFMASQELAAPGTRSRRAAVLEREAEQASLQAERRRLDVVAGVERAYHELRLARHLLALAREQEAVWQEIEASARARYAAGQGAQIDVLRAQVELTRSREPVLTREADTRVRLAELNRRVGRPIDRPLEDAPALRLVALRRDVTELLRTAEEASPELRAAAAAIEARRLDVDLARRAFRPGLTLQAGYMNRADLDPMWQAGVAVSWPLFSRRRERSALAGSLEAETAGRRELDAVRGDLELRTRQRVARLESIAAVAQLYEEGILPQGQLALDGALAQYRAGRSPLVTVLDAVTALAQDRATAVRQAAEHEALKARLLSWSLEPDGDAMSATGMSTRVPMSGGMAPPAASGPAPAAPGTSPGMTGMGGER